jgi:signal transduction histidine kinase/ActR/RegA family two-component response regulator
MIDVLWNTLDKAGLMPHGVCFLWREDLVYMHLLSDLTITLAYFSLPIFLTILVRKKPELKKSGVVPLFAMFILLCGVTHAFNIWVLFVPDYLAQGIVKTMAALVSLITAVLVWPLLPKLIAMPSQKELIDTNEQLRRQIEERKKAEARSERLARAIENMDELVVLLDRDERVLSGNRAWREVNGYPDEQSIVGASLEENIRISINAGRVPEARGREEEWIAERLAQHRKAGELSNVRFDDGQTYRMTRKRFEDGSTIIVGSDITKLLELEASQQQARRMETIGQLTGGIAHDFNNLLAIVIGNLDFLEIKSKGDGRFARHIANARQAAGRGADLTRKLLNFARQETAADEVVDANEVVGGLQEILTRSMTSEIEVEFDLGSDIQPTKADPGDLADVLLNLAINARDAMPNGGKLVIRTESYRIETERDEERLGLTSGDYVKLSVADNGCGMPRDHVEKIFDPFFTTKERGKGTGLGLSMVYAFVKRSGGIVHVESEPGSGTVFDIYLPASGAAPARVENAETAAEDLRVVGSETLLLVDDEEGLLDLAETYFRDLGYRVLTAGNAAEALEKLKNETSVDLMFSDVIMPGGMDGFELADKARSMRPALRIVLASGYTGKLEDWRKLSSSVCCLVEKPYDLRELGTQVRSLLSGEDEQAADGRQNVVEPGCVAGGRLVEAF